MKNLKTSLGILTLGGAVLLLAACGNGNQNTQSTPSSQSQAAVSSSSSAASVSSSSNSVSTSDAASSSVAQTSDLDGTYKGMDEGDSLTLEISGNSGRLTSLEADGEQEIEQVQIDPTNQSMVIGDDLVRYRVDGNQLTIEDLDQEIHERDTVVFTKQ